MTPNVNYRCYRGNTDVRISFSYVLIPNGSLPTSTDLSPEYGHFTGSSCCNVLPID